MVWRCPFVDVEDERSELDAVERSAAGGSEMGGGRGCGDAIGRMVRKAARAGAAHSEHTEALSVACHADEAF